jgi:dimethylglycine catabolism A
MTPRNQSPIFQPLAIGRGGLAARNRVWLPAMVTWRSTEQGDVTEDVRNIYLRYARGGAGVIVLEAIGIRDVASGPLMRLSHDRFVPDLQRLVCDMHAAGDSLVVPQLIDFLKIATRKPVRAFAEGLAARGQIPERVLDAGDDVLEASCREWLPDERSRREFLYGYRQTVGDLSLDEIRKIPNWFRDAARRAKQAGFDGVELHFAHAYTMASFPSTTNPRRDEYGGSLENRLRLSREVIEAVRGQVGRDYIVGCRYLGSEDILREDGSIDGSTLEDARAIGVALAEAGLDFLSVSRGGKFDDAKQPKIGEAVYPYTGHSGHVCMPRDKRTPAAANAYLAEGIRAAVRAAGYTIPIVGSGKIATFELAEQMLRQHKMDAVGMARALLADPDLPRKWLAGEDAEVRECVFCPYCEDEDQHHRVVTCTLWPKDPADRRKRLIPDVWQPLAPSR